MSFFEIFKRKSNQKSESTPTPVITTDTEIGEEIGFVTIPGEEIYGRSARSPSKEWIVAWNGSKEGRYVLYNVKRKVVTAKGSLERPDQGSVADNGIFSLVDLQLGNELRATFYLFASDGMLIVKREALANIYNSAISPNGKLAVFQTANSPTKDGFKLIGFDIENSTELFSVNPTTGLAAGYGFDEEARIFRVEAPDIGTFRYDAVGNFLDEETFRQACLRSTNYSASIMAAQDSLRGGGVSPEFAREVVGVMQQALRNMEGEYHSNWDAIAFRVQGECYEIIEDFPAALKVYEKALERDPKIGVKRKISQLKKNIER